jgi:hypothetical protein
LPPTRSAARRWFFPISHILNFRRKKSPFCPCTALLRQRKFNLRAFRVVVVRDGQLIKESAPTTSPD